MKPKLKTKIKPLRIPPFFQIDKLYYVVYTMATENGPYTYAERYKLIKAERQRLFKNFVQLTMQEVKTKRLQKLYVEYDNVFEQYAKILKNTFIVDPRTTLYKKLIYKQYYKYKTVKKQLTPKQKILYDNTIQELKAKDYQMMNNVTY